MKQVVLFLITTLIIFPISAVELDSLKKYAPQVEGTIRLQTRTQGAC